MGEKNGSDTNPDIARALEPSPAMEEDISGRHKQQKYTSVFFFSGAHWCHPGLELEAGDVITGLLENDLIQGPFILLKQEAFTP